MKAYVINIPTATDRLARFHSGYPSCLPECTVWKAKTGEDITPPGWWQSTANRYALVQNFIDIFDETEDLEEDVLIFEDDCLFCEDFDTRYSEFMSKVPEDAEMIYLGAQHCAPPTQISEKVMRIKACFGSHAIIYTPSGRKKLNALMKADNWSCKHYSDQRKAQAIVKGEIIAYSPLQHLCGQSGCYSYLTNSIRPVRWFNDYAYIDLNGKLYNPMAIHFGLNRPEVAKEAITVYYPICGRLGNMLSFVSYGEYLKENGFKVIYSNRWRAYNKSDEFNLNNLNKLQLSKYLTFDYIDSKKLPNVSVVHIQDVQTADDLLKWRSPNINLHHFKMLPEYAKYIPFNVKEEECVGVHIRIGDYKLYTDYLLISATDYYTNACQWLKDKGIKAPVKVFIEYIEELPPYIVPLFEQIGPCEVVSGELYSDFNQFASCKYKVLADSTFSVWAAYALPSSVVCYPKITDTRYKSAFRGNSKKPEWEAVSI